MTRIYGCSDDLIEFDGDFSGEVGVRDDDDEKEGTLIVCSDGTVLDVKYGKGGRGIWQVTLLRKGDMLDRIDQCSDEDADPYSDVAIFSGALSWAYAAGDWAMVD